MFKRVKNNTGDSKTKQGELEKVPERIKVLEALFLQKSYTSNKEVGSEESKLHLKQ